RAISATPHPASPPDTTPRERPVAVALRKRPRPALETGADTEGGTGAPTVDDLPPDLDEPETADDLEPFDTAPSLPRVVASRVMGTPSYMAPEQRRTGIYDAPDDRFPSMDALLDAIAYDPARARRGLAMIAGAFALIAIAAWALISRGGSSDRCGDARALAGAWDDDVAARIDRALRATGKPYAAATSARVAAQLGLR